MSNVILFSFAPRRLGDRFSVSAAFHYGGHGLTETESYVLNSTAPTGILRCIVKKSTDSLILVCTVFEGDTDHAKEMGDVGSIRGFSLLACVNQHRIIKC